MEFNKDLAIAILERCELFSPERISKGKSWKEFVGDEYLTNAFDEKKVARTFELLCDDGYIKGSAPDLNGNEYDIEEFSLSCLTMKGYTLLATVRNGSCTHPLFLNSIQ